MIIDGKAIAAEVEKSVKRKVESLKRKPKLAIILIGDDPASKVYVNLKVKKAKELGIETEIRTDLNTDADGIIVQLPGGENLIEKIPLEKDVDGLRENSPFLPATVKAILSCWSEAIASSKRSYRASPSRMTWVIVGQGRLVGKPLAKFLKSKSFKVIKCDINTKNLKEKTLQGDVLVVATRVPNLIKKDMVKPGAIVIDCGSPKPEVDFEKVKEVAGWITPVPGGVGPLTVVSLLENLVEAAKIQTHA